MAEKHATVSESAVRDAGGYSFGPFTLDVGRSALLCDGKEVSLRPKAFDVLLCLVRHPQRLVSREALLRDAWPGVVVTDDSLTQCLIEIRKALGDEDKRFIRTVPRRGYLFELPVRRISANPPDPAPVSTSAPAAYTQPGRPSRWTVAGMLLLGVAVAATWWRAGSVPGAAGEWPASHRPQPDSVAVLPFVDMSPFRDQEYLADGIAEEILNLLAQVRGLRVIARTSSFSFKDQKVDIGTISRRLNVAYVLEGSVRKSGDRVRITAQLVDGATGTHLWSETYDRQLQDVFATQDEIAHDVTAVLRAQLLGESGTAIAVVGGRSREPDPRAWELYLRGRHIYGRRMEGDLVQAQRYFEQALELDPGLAPAWVSLAATYNVRRAEPAGPNTERLSEEAALPLMRQALEAALALDPDNPEALLRMAPLSRHDGDLQGANDQIRQAILLGRNNAVVQAILAGRAFEIGEPALAVELSRRSVALDPLNAVWLGIHGQFSYYAGYFEEAEAALEEAVLLSPERGVSELETRARIAILRGELDRAAELAEVTAPGPAKDQLEALLASRAGDRSTVHAALNRLRASEDPLAPGRLAEALAFRGEIDSAFESLNAALSRLDSLTNSANARQYATELRCSPFLQPLHGNPLWEAWSTALVDNMRQVNDETVLAQLRDYVGSEREIALR